MPLPLLAIAAGATVLANGVKAFKGAKDAADGKRLQRSLVRPDYKIEDEYYTNQSLAQNLAQSGLTQEAKDYYTDQSQAGLTYGVDATLRGGGGVNSIASLYDTYNENNSRVAAQDSQMRISNIKSLMDQNLALAGQKTNQWAINEYEPYKDNSKAAAQAIAAGNQTMWNGISGVTGAISSYAQAKTYQDALGSSGTGGGSVPVPPGNFGMNSMVDTPVSGGQNDPMTSFLENSLRSRTYKNIYA